VVLFLFKVFYEGLSSNLIWYDRVIQWMLNVSNLLGWRGGKE